MHKTISLLALPVLLALTACPNMTGAHKGEAEAEAKEWATKLDMEYKSISCVAKDTNDDGYVSCTILMKDGVTTKAVVCAGARGFGHWIRNEGCKSVAVGGA